MSAAPGTAASADLKPRLHDVAIISLMGDTIYFQPANVWEFSLGRTASRMLDRAELDDEITGTARDTLRADAPDVHFAAANDVPRDALLADAARVFMTDEGAVNAVRTGLTPWREAHPADLIVVLLPMQSSLENHAQPRMFFGMGVSWNEGVVLMQALVLDGRTGEVLGTAKARAIAPLSFKVTADAFLDPAPEAKAGLSNDMKGLLASMLPGLLHDAGL